MHGLIKHSSCLNKQLIIYDGLILWRCFILSLSYTTPTHFTHLNINFLWGKQLIIYDGLTLWCCFILPFSHTTPTHFSPLHINFLGRKKKRLIVYDDLLLLCCFILPLDTPQTHIWSWLNEHRDEFRKGSLSHKKNTTRKNKTPFFLIFVLDTIAIVTRKSILHEIITSKLSPCLKYLTSLLDTHGLYIDFPLRICSTRTRVKINVNTER